MHYPSVNHTCYHFPHWKEAGESGQTVVKKLGSHQAAQPTRGMGDISHTEVFLNAKVVRNKNLHPFPTSYHSASK